MATPESAPTGGETVYAMTKTDQERLVLNWSRQVGIRAVALRFACTYGPRQSVFNPYTGVIAVFCTRLMNGLAVNVGTGQPTSVRRLAEILSDLLDARIKPEIPGAYRPGEMRALTPDISRAAAAGFQPSVTLEDGLARYVQWLREHGPVAERFGESLDRLRARRMVHEVAS